MGRIHGGVSYICAICYGNEKYSSCEMSEWSVTCVTSLDDQLAADQLSF